MKKQNRRINVAVIEPVGCHGGMDFYNYQLCESLTDVGWGVTLFTSSGYESGRPRHSVVDSFAGVFGGEAKWLRGLRFVYAVFQTFNYARNHGVKLAHFQLFHVGALEYMNVLIARAMGLKVIVTAHDVGSFRAGERAGLLRKLYRLCSAIIAHSHTAQNTLIKEFGINGNKIYCIPHGNYTGFLPAFPKKEIARNRLGISTDDVVVVFFGQCKKVKRLDLLIEALGRARERNAVKLKLLVAGSVTDADGQALTTQMQNRLGDSAIHHARFISNAEIPIYLAAADVAALPYDKIFQSGVVLLAMTYGVPVLTSDIDGMKEIVKHKHTGLNFRVGDVEDLTQRLIEIERGDWPLSEYARNAESYVETHHSWKQCGEITGKVYRQVLNV